MLGNLRFDKGLEGHRKMPAKSAVDIGITIVQPGSCVSEIGITTSITYLDVECLSSNRVIKQSIDLATLCFLVRGVQCEIQTPM